MKFLVIDDNVNSGNVTIKTLEKLGACDVARDGVEGLYMAETNTYDLVVTELILPKKGGFDIVKELRTKSNCPLIMLTSLNTIAKKVEALRLGADDYIVKPFDKDEFVARTEALLRRYNNNFHSKYVRGSVELDYNNKMLKVNGEYVKMSGKIYDILEFLVRSHNIIVSKEQLFNRIWGLDSDTIITVVEVYVSKLRKILNQYGCGDRLKTIKNMGYMWAD